MSLTALKDYTYYAKYANWKDGRRETWKEAVNRVKGMMLEKYKDIPEVHEDIEFAYEMMYKRKVLGSQRALQFGGEEILKKNMKMYNCLASYCDRPRFFQETMYLLLCGCGTGFSVQKHHVEKLPNLITTKYKGSKTFVVEDSIEGWADAVGVLICSYFDGDTLFPEYNRYEIDFDFSQVRPEGAPIGRNRRKAPGPEPLKRSLGKVKEILDKAMNEHSYEFKKLKPIECYDIVMHISDAVLSGGIRRSATLCMFSHDDEEMLKAKTGNWFYENPQRARSNNSALLLKDQITYEQFASIMESVKQYGEPGYIWSESTEQLFNPCVEASFYPVSPTGESAWQACNLSTINWGKIHSEEEFYEACRAASIIGTLQAGFTDVGYLTVAAKETIEREALLGVSGTGWLEKPELSLREEVQRKGAKIVIKTNQEIAKKIGINPTARGTLVKPEGSSSSMLGTSSGIHPHNSKRYIRNVQANRNEALYQYFKSINPKACQESVWSANKTDDVISFCIEVPPGSKTKNQISALDLLEIVKLIQKNWVQSGKVEENCTQPWLSHNVSNTINVKEDEWEDVTKYIYKNKKYFAGISLLPVTGDKDYKQAPFTAIYLPSEMAKYYGDWIVFVAGLIEAGLNLYEDDLWTACDALLGRVEVKGKAKLAWKERCEKFAGSYTGDDMKKLTYAMKDVYNYKLWVDLNREYKYVDYTDFREETNSVDHTQESVCAGGSCELTRF